MRLINNIPCLIFGIVSGFVFGYLWVLITCQLLKINKYSRIKGYHIHHSLFGVISIIFATIFAKNFSIALFLTSLGVGLIIHDFIEHKKLKFITKD